MIAHLFRPGGPFFLIAGPCVLEDDILHDVIALALREVEEELNVPVVFKASFDKANRSRGDATRGPRIHAGLKMLAGVKERHGLPILTDIHEVWQAQDVGKVCDALQVPAALCRQTDLIEAAAATGLPVNLKKGQWVSVSEMQGAVEKVRTVAAPHYLGKEGEIPVTVTERGTFFGYGDLVVDMRNIRRLWGACGVPVIYDGTHSIQRPGLGQAGVSGGFRYDIEPLVRAAVAAGADGLYLEVHPRPEEAPSDGECMLPLDQLLPLMYEVMAIRQAVVKNVAVR